MTPEGGGTPAYTPGFYGPLTERAIVEICAGAILTQNTAWVNVEKSLDALYRAGLTSPERLAACPLPRLEKAVRSSGYYRQKAGRLRDFFRRSLREHPEGLGKWFGAAATRDLREELLSYKGVGPETADSMVLYAAGRASFVIDAYTRRVGERVGVGRGLAYDAWKELYEESLPPAAKVYNEYHALIVRLCKEYCRKSGPLCARCPLGKLCRKRI